MRNRLYFLFITILFLTSAFTTRAAVYIVDRTDDVAGASICSAGVPNDCSLRGAIANANANGPGADTIQFDIGGGNAQTITMSSTPLDDIRTSLTIDGTTQPLFGGLPLIEINGANSVPGTHGFRVLSPISGEHLTVTIKSLVINRFKNDGIFFYASHGITAKVVGCYIGVNPGGSLARGNYNGIRIHAYPDSEFSIGGPAVSERNVISGNEGSGISIFNESTLTDAGTTVEALNNFIGTNAAGNLDLGNGSAGIHMLSDGPTDGYVLIVGDGSAAGRNIISGNDGNGVFATSGAVSLWGNYIGTSLNGNVDLGNSDDGVQIASGVEYVNIGASIFQTPLGNVISGNDGNGIWITDANILTDIGANKIGTNAAGTAALGNSSHGIHLSESGPYTNSSITIGSASEAPGGNTISGNGMDGIHIHEKVRRVKIYGNRIGTNQTATAAIPNTQTGLRIYSGQNEVGSAGNNTASNVISGNLQSGISLLGANAGGNRIYNNFIGTNSSGANLGNTEDGIFFNQGYGNSIGNGTLAGGNRIAFNGGDGGNVLHGELNYIRGNSIYSNGGLGIDLGPDGVNPNSVKNIANGANSEQNFPVIQRAVPSRITGYLSSFLDVEYAIDFYLVDSCDASGYGEGRQFIGTQTVVPNPQTGRADIGFPTSLIAGQFVTATATRLSAGVGDTSEFSQCVQVTPAPTVSFSAAAYTVSENAAARTIVVTRGGTLGGIVTVDYATADGTATAGADYTEKSGTLVFGDGESVKTFDVPISSDTKDETDETINLALSNASPDVVLTPNQTSVLTIVDNDEPPTISVTDVSKTEGNSGTTDFTFQINLSAESGRTVTVNFATADGAADLGDYMGLSGLLTFAPGETSRNLIVSVYGDETQEPDQDFFVNLSTPLNATLADASGTGMILNDDVYYSIGGTIRLADLTPAGGVTVQLSGTQTKQTTTDSNGRYVFENLQPNGSFTVSPALVNYTFSPVNRQYTNLAGGVTNADFTAVHAPARELGVVSGIVVPGQNGGVTLFLQAQGNENSVAFSLNYDPSLVFNPQVSLGDDVPVATLAVDISLPDKVGVTITLPAGQTFPSGWQNIARVMFNTVQTNAASTPVTFGDTPTARQILDAQSGDVQAGYVNGFIFFVAGYEGDVSPRPNGTGNGTVLPDDVAQIGKFVAGIETIPAVNPANEFQRTDCAPRSTSGNGTLSVSDVVQAGRYAAVLDAAQTAGGAMQANFSGLRISDDKLQINPKSEIPNPKLNLAPSAINVVSTSASRGTVVTVSIEAAAEGTENGIGFTLGYDAAKLSNPVVQTGADANGAKLFANTAQSGQLAVVLALPAGQTLAAGTRQILTVQFDVAANAPAGPTPLTFGDAPTLREVANANADVLPSTFTDGVVTILGPTAAGVSIGGRIRDPNGSGLAQVRVVLTDPNGQTRSAVSSSFGYYRFANVEASGTYILTVKSRRYIFTAPTQIVNVTENLENIDFVGEN